MSDDVRRHGRRDPARLAARIAALEQRESRRMSEWLASSKTQHEQRVADQVHRIKEKMARQHHYQLLTPIERGYRRAQHHHAAMNVFYGIPSDNRKW